MPSAEPRIAPTEVVGSGLCIGCGGCASRAPQGAATMAFDGKGLLSPRGRSAWMEAPSPSLARTCPFSPHARDEDRIAAERFPLAAWRDEHVGRFEAAYVGHVAEGEYRARGSSGGLTNWTAAELLRLGLVDGVAHVGRLPGPAADEPLFGYRISRSLEDLSQGAMSRYYPVELSRVLAEIRATPGRYAIIGVPCFIKAVHLLRAEEPVLAERIAFTLGLFCGHMKSAHMAESFAWQLDAPFEDVRRFDHRIKDPSRPANWYAARAELADGQERRGDWWHFADGDWGAGFFQAPACDWCDDVTAETADIAFGDAWLEPYSSDGWGTNVVVVRSPVVHDLVRAAIAEGRLSLEAVDADFVRRTQAAGFRHRREGLAYRLTWRKRGLRPRKRVRPGAAHLTPRRKAVYRMRRHITVWSHRLFGLSRRIGRPGLYLRWARMELAVYRALAWSHGRLGAWFDRWEKRAV